ncbi:MAG: FAD-dependent oxidoreductase [Burkholderiales bacterium]|nr:FAD-dependent oxidoreductase [Burkholderiales bacterium]OJX03444.1 MAG: flavocytochrome C [Burkholderiales bacterium 70-64]
MGRRRFVQALGSGPVLSLAGGGAALSLAGCAAPGGEPSAASGRKLGRVLVVGGGYGGATAAKYLKKWGGPGVEVVLVERETAFVSCPLSNLVIGGSRRIADLTVPYTGLREAGVVVIHDEVQAIDAARRRASFRKIADQEFDRIVVSPGIELDFDSVQGLDAEAQKTILHAWKAGPQTVALRAQLEAMPDGGVYVLSIPKSPYRCPPGPYERVCQVAHYFKTAKPRSKIVVLDANPDIQSKKGLFLAAWNGQYKGLIDYQPNMNVTEVDARNRVAVTELGDKVKADVLNIVPAQRAGAIAAKTGLVNANNRWCLVDWVTLESTAAPGIHVLGDATLSAPAMPKSGHMANQHGKAAAAAIVEILNGRTPQPQMMANTCYSFIDDRNVVHVASVHRYSPEKKTIEPVAGAGGLSSAPSELEGQYANAWARNIWNDMLT